jgi:hypothetical protein
VCALPKKAGPCRGAFPRWWFNKARHRCERFIYGGCRANANNFRTKAACERTCKKRAEPNRCQLSKQPGPCRGYFPRWWFNKATRRCEQFVYGGCQGNANNFATQAECQSACGGGGGGGTKCQSDADCVGATCCHPNACVHKSQKPNCAGVFCTMECRGGTMDCGQGRCVCKNGSCGTTLGQ